MSKPWESPGFSRGGAVKKTVEVSAWTPGTQTVVRHCIDSAIHSRI